MNNATSPLTFSSSVRESTLKAAKGIVLYEGNNSEAFATLHNIRMDDTTGRPGFLPGQAMTREMLAAVVQKLMPETSYDFLPPEMLSIGHNHMVWWCQGGVRNLYFRTDKKDLGERTVRVHLPSLVFAVKQDELSVFALKEAGRPVPETPLFMPPFYNMWDKGTLCRGNVRLPDRSGPESIGAWEDLFFLSAFTHPNLGSEKLSRHPKGLSGLWRDLSKKRWKRFPIGMLAPADMTLSKLVQGLKRG